MQWMDVDITGVTDCDAVVILPTSALRMCENDVLVNMKVVNSHRVAVSVTVSRGTVLSLRRRRLQITGSSLAWETCCCINAC